MPQIMQTQTLTQTSFSYQPFETLAYSIFIQGISCLFENKAFASFHLIDGLQQIAIDGNVPFSASLCFEPRFVPDVNDYLYSNLTGKPLPSLDSFIKDFEPDHNKRKIVLVCFWDMQQRPSRNCILQLSKRAQELKAKDIVVVAVQVSKIEQTKLDEWIKESDIDIPVGLIKGDPEKIQFAWGVKSLPWLILTDENHIVTAEGFAFNELDGEIKTLTMQ